LLTILTPNPAGGPRRIDVNSAASPLALLFVPRPLVTLAFLA
jgi:hypothetical protein